MSGQVFVSYISCFLGSKEHVFQGSPLLDLNQGGLPGHQSGVGQPCDHLRRLLEPVTRHPVYIPRVQVRPGEASLRVQIPRTGNF